jgi:HAD superfamily hydrolase (TIGR01459 family)
MGAAATLSSPCAVWQKGGDDRTVSVSIPRMIAIHDGLSAIADRYDGYIVDLWGVLHDGVRAFPSAVDCMRELRRRAKRIVILSNAPRRAEVVAARCVALGIAPELWDGVVSSGEETWRHLVTRPDAWYRTLGRRCYHLGPERDLGIREALDYDFVADLSTADFILNTGAATGEDSVDPFVPFLEEARAGNLPMICANPDLEVIRGGRREICAGLIARRYEELGGEVRYHGKPDPTVYDACFAHLDVDARGRIAGIGDSLRTDIAGAMRAGIDGIFITGGLQGEELGADAEGNVDPERLSALCAAENARPAAALPALRW